MKKIEAKIERSTDGTYSVYCLQEKFSGMGNTAEEAKKDMIEQMQFFKKTAQEIGFSYPDFLDNEFEVVFKFDPELPAPKIETPQVANGENRKRTACTGVGVDVDFVVI
jgi:predicted RNase H-like HicB family nuclease